jgi:hypothetical protein
MVDYALAPGISFCVAGGRYVFLDLYADRYMCLGEAAERAFARCVQGAALSARDDDDLTRLQQQGLLRSAEKTSIVPCAASPVRRSLPEQPIAASHRNTARAVAGLLRARFDVRYRALARLVAAVHRANLAVRPTGTPDDEQLGKIAAAFERAVLLTGSLNQCLVISLAIMRYPRALSSGVDLVFGVKLRPFQAHAWVQVDDLVVGDTVDAVAPFTPILVV